MRKSDPTHERWHPTSYVASPPPRLRTARTPPVYTPSELLASRRLARQRLAERGDLRAFIATRDGEDIAFIFGGVRWGVFRGLQLSFDNRFRSYGLGNVMQGLMVEKLCEAGVETYDLGTDLAYKRRWSEPGLRTDVIAFLKP